MISHGKETNSHWSKVICLRRLFFMIESFLGFLHLFSSFLVARAFKSMGDSIQDFLIRSWFQSVSFIPKRVKCICGFSLERILIECRTLPDIFATLSSQCRIYYIYEKLGNINIHVEKYFFEILFLCLFFCLEKIYLSDIFYIIIKIYM